MIRSALFILIGTVAFPFSSVSDDLMPTPEAVREGMAYKIGDAVRDQTREGRAVQRRLEKTARRNLAEGPMQAAVRLSEAGDADPRWNRLRETFMASEHSFGPFGGLSNAELATLSQDLRPLKSMTVASEQIDRDLLLGHLMTARKELTEELSQSGRQISPDSSVLLFEGPLVTRTRNLTKLIDQLEKSTDGVVQWRDIDALLEKGHTAQKLQNNFDLFQGVARIFGQSSLEGEALDREQFARLEEAYRALVYSELGDPVARKEFKDLLQRQNFFLADQHHKLIDDLYAVSVDARQEISRLRALQGIADGRMEDAITRRTTTAANDAMDTLERVNSAKHSEEIEQLKKVHQGKVKKVAAGALAGGAGLASLGYYIYECLTCTPEKEKPTLPSRAREAR